jgi:hypothetical protein
MYQSGACSQLALASTAALQASRADASARCGCSQIFYHLHAVHSSHEPGLDLAPSRWLDGKAGHGHLLFITSASQTRVACLRQLIYHRFPHGCNSFTQLVQPVPSCSRNSYAPPHGGPVRPRWHAGSWPRFRRALQRTRPRPRKSHQAAAAAWCAETPRTDFVGKQRTQLLDLALFKLRA